MTAWTVLGIAPTADAAAIRRAYARCLKVTRPDEDPDEFQVLLRARDAALGEAAAMGDPGGAEAQPEEPDEEADAPGMPVPVVAPAAPAATTATTAPPPDAGAAGNADPPRIVVADLGETDAAAHRKPPVPRIVVTAADEEQASRALSAAHAGFSLEARERHWAAARRLAAQATALLSTGRAPAGEIARILGGSADLPRGPRQEVEAAFIEAVGRHLRLPNGRFDGARVAQVRAIFGRGERVFGWLRDDKCIHALLGARDAAAFCLIGQEEDRWMNGPPKLLDSDARILFADSPRYMRVYEAFRQHGRLAWRFDLVAFAAPPLWAFYRHRTLLAYATLALLFAAGVLMASADSLGDLSNLAGAGILLSTHVGTALLADRFVMWGAVRTVRRARKELRYDPQARADFLRQNGQTREFGLLLMFLLFASLFLMLPYVAAYARLEQAAAALRAWLGW